eukprot:Opistho-2@76795
MPPHNDSSTSSSDDEDDLMIDPAAEAQLRVASKRASQSSSARRGDDSPRTIAKAVIAGTIPLPAQSMLAVTLKPADCPSRIAKFDKLYNFRDVGGIGTTDGKVVRTGLIFRSSRPDHATEGDLNLLSKVHGVRTIIDLRSPDESAARKGAPVALIDRMYKSEVMTVDDGKRRELAQEAVGATSIKRASRGHHGSATDATAADVNTLRRIRVKFLGSNFMKNVVWKSMPWYAKIAFILLVIIDKIFHTHYSKLLAVHFVVKPRGIRGQYRDFLDHCKSEIVVVLRLIADPKVQPVLIHCAHGKDRTGVVLALTLSILGVPETDISLEYGLTETGLGVIQHRVVKEIKSIGLTEEFAHALPDTMRHTLAYVRENYGSVRQYLIEAGFTDEEQEAMRGLCLING